MNPRISALNWTAWIFLTVLGLVALIVFLRGRISPPDTRPEQGKLEPWMLEALPAIGPASRDRLCAAANVYGVEVLPLAAQPMARKTIRWKE